MMNSTSAIRDQERFELQFAKDADEVASKQYLEITQGESQVETTFPM